MDELTITPNGRFVLKHVAADEASRALPRKLVEAFEGSPARGLLYLACEGLTTSLPVSLEFARSLARLYVTSLCKQVTGEPGEKLHAVPAPREALDSLVVQAPPMVGLEYLTLDALETCWSELDSYARQQIAEHPEGATGYFRQHNASWRFVGRVTFHLAENKRNPDCPFAFMATFANGLTAQGLAKHEPLQRALQQYAGQKNREAMLKLLLPISRAAESSEFIRQLVDSEQIYHPLAWTSREAYEFLQAVPVLEASGLIVRVPDWWSAQKPPRPQVSVRINTPNSESIGLNDMMQFSVAMSLGGETLTLQEMEQLLESSGGLVPLKGKWVEVDREKLQAALDHWKTVENDVRHEGISFFDGMRMLSGVNLNPEADAKQQADIREWSGLAPGTELDAILTRLRSPETQNETAPPGLKASLREYQRVGYGWLRLLTRLGLGACLADDMGLGKTIQVISLLLDLKRDGNETASLLVVPASLIANWKSELTKFAPSIRFAIAHPSEGIENLSEQKNKSADQFDLVITTYGMLVRTEWLRTQSWRLAILDEAQAIKNSGTKQSRSVNELKARSRIAMTGTPIENRLSDLWSLFNFLNPGLLGTSKQFSSFIKRLQGGETPSFAPLRNLVRPYILRRLKTDKRVITDLPDKTEVKAYCPLSKHQAALYQKAVEDLSELLKSSDGIQRRGIVLAQLMRLKQICNHPDQLAGSNAYRPEQSGKFQRLAEIVDEIASRQEKVLVFTQFREITDPLSEFLATFFGRAGSVLHGGTSIKKRQEIVNDFQRDDGSPFLILSLKAGGTGLNLTAASHVVHFDRWWNPAIENQATDRAYRIGQKKNVLVHKFVCRGTVEERIDEMITRKSQVAGEVIGGNDSGEVLLTEMDNDTLLQFVKLDLEQAIAG